MKYKTPAALRQAIQHHIRLISKSEGIEALRLRRYLAFERFLARIFKHPSPTWVLKGGYAMELRVQGSRATRDIDLAVPESNIPMSEHREISASVYEQVTTLLDDDLGDFFTFKVAEEYDDIVSPPFGGICLFVDALLGNRLFVRFHVDVGFGDAEIMPLETLSSRNLLAFAGVECPPFPSIPREQHFAEKIYIYTTLRDGKIGSRVKDLVDMVLLIQNGMDKTKLARALSITFDNYKKHPLPRDLPVPPTTWQAKFTELAGECGLAIGLEDAYTLVRDFYSKLTVTPKL